MLGELSMRVVLEKDIIRNGSITLKGEIRDKVSNELIPNVEIFIGKMEDDGSISIVKQVLNTKAQSSFNIKYRFDKNEVMVFKALGYAPQLFLLKN